MDVVASSSAARAGLRRAISRGLNTLDGETPEQRASAEGLGLFSFEAASRSRDFRTPKAHLVSLAIEAGNQREAVWALRTTVLLKVI